MRIHFIIQRTDKPCIEKQGQTFPAAEGDGCWPAPLAPIWARRMLVIMAIMALWLDPLSLVSAAPAQSGRRSKEPVSPVLKRPNPETPYRGEDEVRVPIGRLMHLRLEESLSSKSNRVGDRFVATIAEPVQVNGRVVLPQGTRVTGRVTSVRRARRRSKPGNLGVEFVSLQLTDGEYDIVGSLASLDEAENERLDEEETVKGGSSKKRNAVFIGGGAGVGAAIGAISGGGKGTAIGAGAGAVAGVAGALLSKGKEVQLDPGAEFGMRLERELVIPGGAGRK